MEFVIALITRYMRVMINKIYRQSKIKHIKILRRKNYFKLLNNNKKKKQFIKIYNLYNF